jgi:hypothetical protein
MRAPAVPHKQLSGHVLDSTCHVCNAQLPFQVPQARLCGVFPRKPIPVSEN